MPCVACVCDCVCIHIGCSMMQLCSVLFPLCKTVRQTVQIVTGSRKRGHFAHKMIFQYKRF